MHHHSSPLALDTRNTSSASALSPGSLSSPSASTVGSGGMAAVATPKEHPHYPPPLPDHQQHHPHHHPHNQHHQDHTTENLAGLGNMHLHHQQGTGNYIQQSSPPPLTSTSSSSVAALQRIAASASLDPVASQSTSLAVPSATSVSAGIDPHHSHHHSFSSPQQHSQLQHPSSHQQHHVHQRHQQHQHQQHYHQDRTSPDEMTSSDPSNNDNNNGKNSNSDINRDLNRNGGGSSGAMVKKSESDHGGGGILHHGGGHHQTTTGGQHHSSPAPLDRTYSSHTQHQGGPQEDDLPGHAANAQYLSANCVIFTYFDKNISEAVNEHFSRSELFRDSATVGSHGNSPSSPSSVETEKSKGCLPMAQRQFPASFWISDYQHPATSVPGASGATSSLSSLAMGHAALISGHHTTADLYGAAAHDPYANLFGYGAAGNATGNAAATSSDPWQNYMAAGMGAAYASQRSAAHDMYTAATAAHSRHAAASAQSHYSSLLQLQNTMRQAGMAGSVATGGLQGRAAASAIDGYAAGSAHSHYGAAGLTAGLEGTMKGSSNELSYWGF